MDRCRGVPWTDAGACGSTESRRSERHRRQHRRGTSTRGHRRGGTSTALPTRTAHPRRDRALHQLPRPSGPAKPGPMPTTRSCGNQAVIGEAVKSLPDEFKQELAGTPRLSIAGVRDVVVHEHFRVNPDLIRDIVDNQLAPSAVRPRGGAPRRMCRPGDRRVGRPPPPNHGPLPPSRRSASRGSGRARGRVPRRADRPRLHPAACHPDIRIDAHRHRQVSHATACWARCGSTSPRAG